jgi:hypothetical protein
VFAATLVVAANPSALHADQPRAAATEVGVTSTEIHIAVIADVDNPIVPNLFGSSRNAVQGFARYVNTGCPVHNTCLAGRKLVVDFYDSHLNANDARTATIEACENDVALVGTSTVMLSSVDDMRNCPDHASKTTGLPDIPFVTSAVSHECSDESFPIAPPPLRCATKEESPQTYVANVARGTYFTKKYDHLHGIYIFPPLEAPRINAFATLGALRNVGKTGSDITSDGDFDFTSAIQSDYTPMVQRMKDEHSNYAQCTNEFTCTVLLRKEAALQGVDGQVKVWDCSASCYDKDFLGEGGSAVNKEYVDTLYLPFYDRAEQQAVPMLAHFVQSTGTDKADGIGIYAWAAAVAFRDAVNATVEEHGINGITRANLFTALDHIHRFDADGILAPIDLAGRTPSDCHVLMQVRNGKFVRVAPTKPGTFDCNPKYLLTQKLDLLDR